MRYLILPWLLASLILGLLFSCLSNSQKKPADPMAALLTLPEGETRVARLLLDPVAPMAPAFQVWAVTEVGQIPDLPFPHLYLRHRDGSVTLHDWDRVTVTRIPNTTDGYSVVHDGASVAQVAIYCDKLGKVVRVRGALRKDTPAVFGLMVEKAMQLVPPGWPEGMATGPAVVMGPTYGLPVGTMSVSKAQMWTDANVVLAK